MDACTIEVTQTTCVDEADVTYAAEVELKPGVIFNHDPDDSFHKLRSILFPRDPKQFRIPVSTENYWILFLPLKSRTGEFQLEDSPPGIEVAYSLGINSLVLITLNKESVVETWDQLKAAAPHFEEWEIREKKVHTRKLALPSTQPSEHDFPPKDLADAINSCEAPNVALVINEAFANLKRYNLAAIRFDRNSYEFFKQIESQILEAATIAIETLNEMTQLLAEITDESREAKKVTLNAAKARHDQSLEYLITASSSLVYATTQCFAGVSPIGTSSGLMRLHALLGTSIAWRAIFNLYFEIVSIIENTGAIRSAISKFQPTDNKRDGNENQKGGPANKRIVHYSARQGFSEDDATITFPSQCVCLSASPTWTLLTVTHEILHAHVRELLSIIFTTLDEDDNPDPFDISLSRHIIELQNYAKCNECAGFKFENASEQDQVRFKLIACCIAFSSAYDQIATTATASNNGTTNRCIRAILTDDIGTVTAKFRDGFKFLEEILVHTLDLCYFYNRNPEVYCNSIWHTWAVVPTVTGRLDLYILRTLVAIACVVKSPGPELDRIKHAMITLRATAEQLAIRPESCSVANRILLLLSEEKTPFTRMVALLGPLSLMFADFCAMTLLHEETERYVSRNIYGSARYGDEGIEPYKFPIGDENTYQSPLGIVFRQASIELGSDEMRPLTFDQITRRTSALLHKLALQTPQ